MQYIVDNIKNANSTNVNDITILEFENFFPPEHLEQLMWATKQTQFIDAEDSISGFRPSAYDMDRLLDKEPLTSAEIKPVWNNAGWLADSLIVTPNSKEGCFDYISQRRKHSRNAAQVGISGAGQDEKNSGGL